MIDSILKTGIFIWQEIGPFTTAIRRQNKESDSLNVGEKSSLHLSLKSGRVVLSEGTGPITASWVRGVTISASKRGRPTYVAVWEVTDKKIKIVEVTYVGTREKAPY